MVVIYHEDVNTSWSCWIGLNRTHQRHDEPVRIGTRQRESILDIADTEKHMYSSWSRFVTVMKMMKMSWRLLTIQKKSPSICSAFLVIQPTNRCTWKRRLAPWNQPEKWCKLHPPNSWSSASLGNILMIAIDLGLCQWAWQCIYDCLRADGPARDVSSQNRVDPPKGVKFQPPRPWEDSGL